MPRDSSEPTRWPRRRAITTLRAGGLIAYPTEAVYGLGCDPDHLPAVHRLLRLKRRPVAAGLILIAADWAQLAPYAELPVTNPWTPVARAGWPGPLTWIVPARPRVPRAVSGVRDTIAVRVTAHPVARALCQDLGKPLISTSANRRGDPPLRTARAVRAAFGHRLDGVVPGATGYRRRPTPIRSLRDGRYRRSG